MQLLSLSGSTRTASTNTRLLRSLEARVPPGVRLVHCDLIRLLPIFNPDDEGERTPTVVEDFCGEICEASGVIIASPEYVRGIPGGLKNAIDWLVSRDEIIHKPMALVHASHRGDDMLDALRRVLATVTTRFYDAPLLTVPLMSLTPAEAARLLASDATAQQARAFLRDFVGFIGEREGRSLPAR